MSRASFRSSRIAGLGRAALPPLVAIVLLAVGPSGALGASGPSLPRAIDLATPGGSSQPTLDSRLRAETLAGSRVVSPVPTGTPLAPVVTTLFAGISQADSGANPPDEWVAANATSVVESVNGQVTVFDRSGNVLQSMATWAFFGVPVGQEESDPRILWDATHGRWVGSIVSKNADFSANVVYVAVSETANPLGAWDRFAFPTGGTLPDQPTLASSTGLIVVTANDFRGAGAFLGAAILAIDWSSILSGGSPSYRWTPPDPSLFSIRPARVLSPSLDVHLIAEDATGTSGDVMYKDLSGPAATVSTAGFIDVTSGPPFVAPFSVPPPPHQTNGTIAFAVDERPLDAVWQNGVLWFVATTAVAGPGGTVDGARFTGLDTTTAVPTAIADFVVTAPGVDVYTPGVTLMGNGTVVATFTTSSASADPDVEFATWTSSAGLSVPQVLDVSGGPFQGDRWGDYAGLAPDPLGAGAAWIVGQLAAADGTWLTDVGRIAADADPPTTPAAGVQATIVAPSTLVAAPDGSASSVPVRLSWGTASDATSGIGGYAVGEAVDGTGTFVLGTVPGTSLSHPIAVGHSYSYVVHAIDTVGNAGPDTAATTVVPVLYEQTTHVTYAGPWSTVASATYSGGSARTSSTAGATATFTFVGTGVALVASRGLVDGSIRLYLDGRYVGARSLYLRSSQSRQVVFASSRLAAGAHRLVVVVAGTAGHPRVDVDAFVVLR